MAETFVLGEQKVRPGTYFNIQKKGDSVVGAINGVTAVLFRADFGPLCTALELSADDGYETIFGTGLTTDAMKEAIYGGAETLIACRVGSGGTFANVTLLNEEDTETVKITAKYPGDKEFTVSIRERLVDATRKECIIYAGTTEFEKVSFLAGEGEAAALVEAMRASKKFQAEVLSGQEQATLQNVSQFAFEKGSNPAATIEDYSSALEQVEACTFNTICVDTEDPAIHLLLASFINRVFDAGLLTQAVVAERHETYLETRIEHAMGFNDEKMNYVLNAHVMENGKEIDGYQTAARIAGMIGACTANTSLTHTVIPGFTEILERLTNTQMIRAEKKGCLVFSYSSKKQVWIDNAINTLITPAENQDEGWKKIRRVKTRFELIKRINITSDALVGKVDNDTNGRSTAISQIQAVGNAMIAESKLISCKVTESTKYPADGDSAWFDIDVVDKDSMEHIYLTFWFQFSTNV